MERISLLVFPREKGGQEVNGVPIFDTVEQAVKATGANVSIIFVPAPFAADAILEASYAGAELGCLYYRTCTSVGYDQGNAFA